MIITCNLLIRIIKQIISGAGSKSTAARAINQMIFLWKNGYATLDLYENGKSTVSFFSVDKNQSQLLFKKTVLSPKVNIKVEYANHFPSTKKTSVYSPEMTDKSAIHNLIFLVLITKFTAP
jgi:hypothetical protein